MKNANELIHPILTQKYEDGSCENKGGLTKREYFAGLAMQGLLANPNFNGGEALNNVIEKCQSAIAHADELLKQLEENK